VLVEMSDISTPGARHVFIRPHCPWQNGKAREDLDVMLYRLGLTPAKV
jgi:hypothetical protein